MILEVQLQTLSHQAETENKGSGHAARVQSSAQHPKTLNEAGTMGPGNHTVQRGCGVALAACCLLLEPCVPQTQQTQ